MSRLVIVSQTRDIDLETLFAYILSAVPLNVLYPDLLKETERELAIENLEDNVKITLTLIDFMVLTHMICTETSKCETFGELSDDLMPY